jgi:hypothetical protein
MRKLESREKLLKYYEARLEGRRPGPDPAPEPGTYEYAVSQEEKRRLRQQQHTRLSQMSEKERTKLQQEQDAMWATIPAHLREKAKRYTEELV